MKRLQVPARARPPSLLLPPLRPPSSRRPTSAQCCARVSCGEAAFRFCLCLTPPLDNNRRHRVVRHEQRWCRCAPNLGCVRDSGRPRRETRPDGPVFCAVRLWTGCRLLCLLALGARRPCDRPPDGHRSWGTHVHCSENPSRDCEGRGRRCVALSRRPVRDPDRCLLHAAGTRSRSVRGGGRR